MRTGVKTGANRQFAARVTLYAALDERLHTTIRFFGAAACTNAALVELCSLPCPGPWAYGQAINSFGLIGAHLESMNITLSQLIERGNFIGHDLDSSLVTLEQNEVEHLLRKHNRDAHFERRSLEQINRLLYCADLLTWPLRHCPSIRLYGQVLRQIRVKLGRSPDFAILSDRIDIGHHLTRLLRSLHLRQNRVVDPAL